MKPQTSGQGRRSFFARVLSTLGFTAMLAMAAGSRAADTISFNHATASGTAVTPDNQIVWPETAGAPAYNVGYWNNVRSDWSGTAGAVPSPLLDSLGNTVAGLSIGYDGPNCYNNGIATTDGSYKLMRNYLDSNDANGGPSSGYVTLSGVPYRKYDVVIYADGDGGSGATDGPYVLRYGTSARQDNASTEAAMNRTNILRPAVWLKETGNFSGTFTAVGVNTSITVAAAASGNYMVFEGLKGNLTIDPTQTSGTSRAPLNGYQLVKWETAGAIPGADDATAKIALYGGNVTVAANLTIGALATSAGTYGDLIINPGVTLTLANGDLDMGDINHWVKGGGMLTAGNNTLTILRDVSAGLGYVSGATDAAINGVTLVDNGATPLNVIKTGAGKLRLSSANPYTGTTTISQGSIEVGNASALGGGVSTITLGDAQTSYFDTGLYLRNGVTLARSLAVNNSGAAVATPTLGSLEAGSQSFSGGITLNRTTIFTAVAGSTVSFGGTIGGPGGLTKTGSGTVNLSGANAYSGGTLVSEGALYSQRSGNASQSALTPGQPVTIVAGSTLGMGSVTDGLGWYSGNPSVITNRGTFTANAGYHHSVGRYVLDGGTITSAGAGDATGNYIFDGQIDVIGTAASTISAHTIQLRGGASSTGIVFNVANGSAVVDLVVTSRLTGTSLRKDGAGAMSLAAASAYTGGTTVNNGLLLVNSAAGSGTGSGGVTVNAGGTLGGTGIIAGAVTVAGGAKFAAGNSVGTNTVGSLTLTNGAVFEVEVDGGGVDQTVSLGAVDLGGATLSTVALSAPTFTSALILSNATGQITGQFAGLFENDQVLIGGVPYYLHYRPTYVELNLSPTAVVLHQFGAIAEGAGVVVRWRTASEVRTAGFDLYRKVGGEWVKVNDALIAAAGAPQGGVGAAYAVADGGAAAGGTYEYKLVEIEQDGSQRDYGPYERTATAFEMTSPIRATAEGMEVRWLSREGERYRVLRATDLRNPVFDVIGDGLDAVPPENVFLDTNAAPLRVYRIELEE